MSKQPKNWLKAQLAQLWVRGSILALGRARLDLGTTRICSTTAERLRDLLEVG